MTDSIVVANDLADCPEHGLVIGASSIDVDLDGRTIDGVGLGAGVLIDGHDDVTISGGTVRDFDMGLLVTGGAGGSEVAAVRFELNQEAAVLLSGAAPGTDVHGSTFVGNALAVGIVDGTEGAVVRENSVGEGSGSGLEIIGSNGNRIERNYFAAASDGGVVLEGSSNNVLIGNDVSGVSDAALLVTTESNGNRLEGNTLSASDGGIIVDGSVGNILIGNVVREMSDVGIDLDSADGTVVIGNDLRFNGEGIALFDSSGNRIEGNDTSGSGGTAIAVEGSSYGNALVRNTADDNGSTGISVLVVAEAGTGNLFDGNTANGNPGGGIAVTGPGHTLRRNVTNDNAGWGIYAADGTIDGGGNSASGNGESAQCFGVDCDGAVAPPVDTIPPDVQITDGPRNPTSVRSASFAFTGDEEDVSLFECSLDDGPFVPCTSPHGYVGLDLGEHRFAVRAIDLANNVDPEPAVFAWTIVAAPDVDCGTSTTIVADGDSWIDQNSATTNKGSDSSLKIRSKGPADNFRTLVHFALPIAPQGCVLEAATLRMNADAAPAGRTLHALGLAGPWSEASVTWANQPATVGAAASVGTGEGYRSWAVRPIVQSMYDTGAAHGFVIRDAAEGDDAEHGFSTRESDAPPQLVLRFVPLIELPPTPTTTTTTTTDRPRRRRSRRPRPRRSRRPPRRRSRRPTTTTTTTTEPTPTTTTTTSTLPPTTTTTVPPTTTTTPTVPPTTTTTTTRPADHHDNVDDDDGPADHDDDDASRRPRPRRSRRPPRRRCRRPPPRPPRPSRRRPRQPRRRRFRRPPRRRSRRPPQRRRRCRRPPHDDGPADHHHDDDDDDTSRRQPPPRRPTDDDDVAADHHHHDDGPADHRPTTTTSRRPPRRRSRRPPPRRPCRRPTTTTTEPPPTTTTTTTTTVPPTTTTTTVPPTTTTTTTVPPTTEPPQCAITTIVSPAVADAWIEQNSPTNNKGDDTTLKVKSQARSDNFRTLVRFNLPTGVPVGCQLVSASLRIDSPSATSGRLLGAWRLAGPWTEMGVNWANQPGVIGLPSITTSGSGTRAWDVTAQALSMLATGSNHGFVIRDLAEEDSGFEQSFSARELDDAPELILRFAAVN